MAPALAAGGAEGENVDRGGIRREHKVAFKCRFLVRCLVVPCEHRVEDRRIVAVAADLVVARIAVLVEHEIRALVEGKARRITEAEAEGEGIPAAGRNSAARGRGLRRIVLFIIARIEQNGRGGVLRIVAADRHTVGIQTEPGRAAIRCKLEVGQERGISGRLGVGRAVREVDSSVDRKVLDHRLQDDGLLLDGAVVVPAPLILLAAAVEEPVNFDFVGGIVGTGKERDDRVAHALMRHVAPAAGVDLFPGHAGALPFRLCVVDAALELLDTEIRAGVIARVPVVRAGAARPAGDGNIVVAEIVGAAGDQTALDAVAVAVAVLDQTVDQIGNVHLRLVEPRIVDIEVVQVILFLSAVAASVVPQPVIAGIGADDLIAGLLAVGVVQDGEIVRPVFVEISVVRQLLPADNVDLRARLVRGLHLILEVPQLQHRAVGGEVAERIALLQLRHAHVSDRVFDRAGRIFIVFRHGIGHRAFFELRHALGGIVVHRGVDRIDLSV